MSAVRSHLPVAARRLALPLIAAATMTVPPAATAAPVTRVQADTAHPAAVIAAAARKPARTRRVGGRVRRAWPAKGHRAPQSALARWLARQVGPKAPPRRRTVRAATSVALGVPTATLPTTTGATKSLQLLRSYEIPRDDPAYDRLLNWSWSYDSAVAAAAFAAEGDREQAARLLDQLGALQHPDGSIETAFEVRTGEAVPSVRAGTVAWVGLAAATYDAAFETDRYRAMAERAAGFLLALRGRDGLIAGGADVAWVSTQHNLVAYALLDRLADELPREDRKSAKEDRKRATEYGKAASEIGTAIEKRLLVSSGREAWFRQGLGDDVRALDTQAIGSMFLRARRRADVGKLVLEGVQKSFALTGRSIARSADLTAFNATYAAVGPFVGYRPFVGTGAPDVLWFEGTAEMRLAKSAFDQDTRDLDASIGRWAAITAKGGSAPLGADRTVTGNEYGEFHVWPTGAAAAWSLLSTETPTFFIEPRSDDDHGEDDDD